MKTSFEPVQSCVQRPEGHFPSGQQHLVAISGRYSNTEADRKLLTNPYVSSATDILKHRSRMAELPQLS
ncbi:hypothetical protein PGT21_011227 [Puccinia graminis f. sp. tritici]|uniref:Uncharacterized protein n=1 Tax=Puccinia graminis f. sp. tritici TaxID=56615 RepID=A0A5B0PB50_PUCGR|nr:hypothetical protein PGT21_011227 [Puccinia graminis f. sp. tritici]